MSVTTASSETFDIAQAAFRDFSHGLSTDVGASL